MKRYRALPILVVATGLIIGLPGPGWSFTSQELSQYKEKALNAPDFTLKGLDGKVYSLKDFRGKIVVIETGSST